MAAAPAAEAVVAAVPADDEVDVEAVAEEGVELVVVLEAEYEAGSRVPHVSLMDVVQFLWAEESPTLARVHSEKASSQVNVSMVFT